MLDFSEVCVVMNVVVVVVITLYMLLYVFQCSK